ncbi:MAG: zeta toxin [Bacteroidota bacterium]
MPNLYIIAGCNGAGKTTASYTLLPEMLNCKEFVNADEIARGLSPFQPDKAAIDAGKIMLTRIKDAQQKGYFVTLVFFWLNNVELAIERVKMRVLDGGHDIPEETIRKRYKSGIANLIKLYIPVCDYWMVLNNSITPFQLISEGLQNNETEIKIKDTWDKIIKQAYE